MKKLRFQITRHAALVSCLILLSITSLSSRLNAEAAANPLKPDVRQTTKKATQLGRGSIGDLQWRSDGSQLAVCGSSGIWLYDPLLRGKNINNDQECWSVSWSPTGQQLAAVDVDGIAKVYDPENGAPLLTLASNDLHLASVCWSSDGSRIVAVATKTFYVFNAQNGQILGTYTPGYSMLSVLWSPDNSYLASAGMAGQVTIWNVKSTIAIKTIDTGITKPIYDMAWNPIGDTLAIAVNNHIKLWDAKQDTITEEFQNNPSKIDSIAFSATGLLALGIDNGGIQIWDITTHTLKTTLGASSRSAILMQWSNKGLIASVDLDDKLQLWDSVTARLVSETDEHNELIKAVTWKPDGKQIAGVEEPFVTASLRVWDITTGKLAFIAETPKGGASAPIAWSPTGDTMAGMSLDGNVIIWDSSHGKIEKILSNFSDDQVRVLAWNNHGDRIAIGMINMVLIWNVKLNQLEYSIDVSRTNDTAPTRVTGIAWSPDQTRLAIASEDGTVRIAEIANQRITLSLLVNQSEGGSGYYSVRWGTDNNYVVSEQGIIDVAARKLSKTFYFAAGIELNSNGTTFAITQEKSIQILNIKNGSTVNILQGAWRDITSVAWNTNNTALAITSSDGLIYIEPTAKP